MGYRTRGAVFDKTFRYVFFMEHFLDYTKGEKLMAVKIRLARFGSKKKPIYRVVVSDVRSPRDGRYIERVGWYDPRLKEGGLKMNLERVKYWISNGAKPTEKVDRLIKRASK